MLACAHVSMCPRACVCMCTVLRCCTHLPHPFLTKGGNWTWAAFCLPIPPFFFSYTLSPYALTVGRLLYVGSEGNRRTFRSITLILPHHLPTYPFRFEYPQMEPHSAYMRKGGHNRPPRRTTRKNNTIAPSLPLALHIQQITRLAKANVALFRV